MVKLRDDVPTLADGRIDQRAWVRDLVGRNARIDQEALERACAFVAGAPRRAELLLAHGIECAELIADLQLDSDSVLTGLVFRCVHGGHRSRRALEAALGPDVAHLVSELEKLSDVSVLELSTSPLLENQSEDQIDNVRKMLVSLIDDVRVAILKLVERIVTLRRMRSLHARRRERIGREGLEVFVPLANRLGIWRLKWELEDLAFRCLNPAEYKRIAARLDGRRVERERQIGELVKAMRGLLASEGIGADVVGRAKNIYSIWKKMRKKGVDLSRVYDMRAVRVLVNDVRDCYTALGIVHTRWHHIPHEFDDYIANPKDNGYRSIHTAVIGPDGKTLEVQIRTHAMHQEAELGVCAHWAYKDGMLQPDDKSFYTEKLSWLRQVLEWHEEIGGFSSVGNELRANIEQDRIFVFTPAGHVLDMSAGATPVDFAYRVHTEVGHRCAGARVDGRWVPLNYPLSTGQRVEIVTRDAPNPNRDWLDTELGYVKTARAKAKLKSWFKALPAEENIAQGRERLMREFERLSMAVDLELAAIAMDFPDADALFQAIGVMDVSMLEVIARVSKLVERRPRQAEFAALPAPEVIDGAGDRTLAFALCCRPDQGSPVIGVPQPDGIVLVHRIECERVMTQPVAHDAGLLSLSWHAVEQEEEFMVRIDAYDRPGLVHAITMIITETGKSMTRLSAVSDASINAATIEIGLKARDILEFARIVEKVRQVPGIINIKRVPVTTVELDSQWSPARAVAKE
jgi:GTP pyrophosphokinase